MIELLHELKNSTCRHRSIQAFDNVSAGKKENLNVCWTSLNNKKSKDFLRTLCAFSILVQLSKIPFFKACCAPASPAALFLWSTARIRQDISAASFCCCKLLWRIDECILLPCFNVQPNIFAVMNRCIVALGVFHSDILTWSANSLYALFSAMTHKIRKLDVEKYAYYVNKLRQNVGLEIWLWRQIVASQTAHTKYKWPPYATEWNPPPWNFFACATADSCHDSLMLHN